MSIEKRFCLLTLQVLSIANQLVIDEIYAILLDNCILPGCDKDVNNQFLSIPSPIAASLRRVRELRHVEVLPRTLPLAAVDLDVDHDG